MAKDNEPRKPTEKEAFFFLTILNSMKGSPDVDWELVAKRAGYSNAVCARTRYGQIKKQIGYKDEGSLATPSPVKSRAKKAVGSGTNGNASKVTKKSPGKGGRGKKAKAVQVEESDDEANIKEESPVPGVEEDDEQQDEQEEEQEDEQEDEHHYPAFQNGQDQDQDQEESGYYGDADAQEYEDGLDYYDTTEDLEI